MKVIVSGGGTGGHIYPAIAIAKAISSANPKAKILFVGAKGRMEMEKVPQAGFKIVGLWISGYQRGKILANLLLPFKVLSALFASLILVLRFKPDVVLGTGGYASWAVVFAAAICRKKIILQEQNSYAGMTNRFLSRWAKVVCVAYPNMEAFFPKSSVLFCGNPIRSDIGKGLISRDFAYEQFSLSPEKRTLLVLGGSLGAATINRAMTNCYKKILASDIQIIWQTGKFYFDSLSQKIESHPNLRLMPFINQMPCAYEIADLVVSRAGALSISEISAVALPSILVPSPNVAEDHQTQNAKSLSDNDAAVLVADQNAEAALGDTIMELFENEEKRKKLSQNISLFAKKDAAQEIAQLTARLIVDTY
jgi:UDP-N-acetylglucosamine--N-acetylmuramyl-(pentapeptide) pyrophosphoryl-undecaprenol N-acetylglucosamine transferase